jgi:hypothetical protein
MGILSWQGDYGPQNTGRLLYPWDILVVAVFSVAIYFWAIYGGSLSKEQIEERIAAQAAIGQTSSLEPEPEAV